jgi:hypothetical protein
MLLKLCNLYLLGELTIEEVMDLWNDWLIFEIKKELKKNG